MPKHKRKDRPPQSKNGDLAAGDEEEYPDDASVISLVSVLSNNSDNRATEGSDECSGNQTAQENYEEKLSACIEGIQQKNLKGRIDSLKSLKSGLSKQFVFAYLVERYATVSDGLEKCLKKGRGEEQILAADCACLLFIQLGSSSIKDELFTSFIPIFKVIINDNSMPLSARCSCAEALGLCTFLGVEDPVDILDLMNILELHFKHSYLHNNNTQQPAHANSQLHNSCLCAWTLLFTLLSDNYVKVYALKYIPLISSLLMNDCMELRITSGEAIALMFEAGREAHEVFDETFETSKFDELCKKLKELSTESNKFRAKKDKKVQKSSFRDILKAVQEGECDSSEIKINFHESLWIETWMQKIYYDNLCRVLSSGMRTQLQENLLLRDIFELGEPLIADLQLNQKNPKLDKVIHKAAFKERTKYRSKQRSKKSTNNYINIYGDH